jgi:ribokinase
MSRIVCVGSMNMDIAAYSRSLPRPGETVFGSSLVPSPGGKGLNQAVAARRLGAEVAFVGCLGRDDNGDAVAAFLAAEGIDTTGILRLEGVSSGAAIILIDAKSENAIVVIPGANMAWPPGAPTAFPVTAGDIVVSQFEIPDAVIIAAFGRARASGARTILNAAPARAMPKALLALVDILVVNESELAAVGSVRLDSADIAAVTAAALALSNERLAVVATLGAAGAVVARNGTATRIAGCQVAAIDTAGAGDCFIGALAAALLRGDDLVPAAAYANRAAALSVTRRGTAIAMPYAGEV